ncbi:MAG: hypothetical protein JNK85_00260 [Verrucomicrobiales bacterium]|nr:hypothetical protein [Verrucomicrobiales bacterium]
MIRHRTASTRLGITWIHSRLEMAEVPSHGATRTWVAPGPVADVAALGEAIAEGIRALESRQRRANLVLDHRSIVFHLQEAPPARGRTLDQLLHRLVAEQRLFPEPAVFTRTPAPPLAGRNRWLLAVLPRPFLNDIATVFAANGIQLAGVFPVATLAAQQRINDRQASVEPELVVTQLRDARLLVIARGSEEIWFARSLQNAEGPEGTRLEQEIHRTLQFAKQRFGTSIRRVVWQRDGSEESPLHRPHLAEPGLEWISSDGPTLSFAAASAHLEPAAPFNFSKAIAGGLLADRKPVALIAAAALVLAVAFATSVEVYRHQALESAMRVDREAHADAEVATARANRQREADHFARFVRSVQTGATNHRALLFARRLVETTPAPLRLSRIAAVQGTNGWEFTLEGATRIQGSQYLGVVEEFEKRLEHDVVPCRVLNSTARQTLAGIPNPIPPSPFPRFQGFQPRTDERSWFISGLLP